MRKLVYLASTIWMALTLTAAHGAASQPEELPGKADQAEEGLHLKSHHHCSGSYALLSNQATVTSGENIPWSSSSTNLLENISVSPSGSITFNCPGLYLVEYTVRINKTPYEGTATATVQLQQTVSGVATNIAQAAITSNTEVDGITYIQPNSQTQITGFALIQVSSTSNNVINLAVTFNQIDSLTIPAATGTDANAQMTILQLR